MRIAFTLALLLLSNQALSDWVTELGVGWRIDRQSSRVLSTDCSRAYLPDPTWMSEPCGGDNPVFIGWPIAFEWGQSRWITHKFGWFHYSSIFDGRNALSGDGNEVHMEALAYSVKFNWTKGLQK